jgi:hypothetical protein
MGFNIDNYELVEDRLKKFWADYPNGRVNTDVVGKSEDGTMVIVKAELFTDIDSKIPVSSGLAQETKGVGGFANNEAWLENCESSAIGRALANWKYQGSKKPRPTQEEMKKVQQPKKKQVVQESGKSPSKPIITELALKKMVMSRCNDDKTFASKCYKQCMERTIIKTNIDNVDKWTQETIKVFEDLVGIYIDKHKDTFEERTNNEPIVNKIIENLGEVVEKEQEVADIPEGKWMEDPISDGQVKFIETLIKQVIDDGQDELGAEAKQYLSSGEATKGNASKMIDKLKDALS